MSTLKDMFSHGLAIIILKAVAKGVHKRLFFDRNNMGRQDNTNTIENFIIGGCIHIYECIVLSSHVTTQYAVFQA